jgi:hypothetical protein
VDEAIRLYLDEDTISRSLIRALRSRAVDLVTANEAGLVRVPDEEHLTYATSLGRALLTFNVRDFATLHTHYLSAGRHHAGVIVSDQAPVGVLLRRLLKLMSARSAVDMCDELVYLSTWR